MSKYIF